MSFHTPYRWCIVPNCNNTTSKTPEKLFINLPNDINMRNAWIQLSGRDPTTLSIKSTLHLCEDHFDLENDMENYMELKIMGSVKMIRMKPNTVPSRFSDKPVTVQKAETTSVNLNSSMSKIKEETVQVKEESSSTSSDELEIEQKEPFVAVEVSDADAKECVQRKIFVEVPVTVEITPDIIKEEPCDNLRLNEEVPEVLYDGHEVKRKMVIGEDGVQPEIKIAGAPIPKAGPSSLIQESTGMKVLVKAEPQEVDIEFEGPEETVAHGLCMDQGNHGQMQHNSETHQHTIYLNNEIILERLKPLTGEKTQKCTYCDFTSIHKNNLRSHERTHTGERPFKCSYCDYRSAQKKTLKVHERTHTGEKPYKCTYCSYAAGDKNSLKVHIKTHTGEKPYKCNYCSYASNYRWHLKHHERIHTGEKPFNCNYCSYTSKSKSHLRIHVRTHTGEKPYQCSQCSYSSAQKNGLKMHERIHTGLKPFKCSNGNCSYSSAQKRLLINHEKKCLTSVDDSSSLEHNEASESQTKIQLCI